MTTVTNGAGVWYRPDDNFGPASLVFLWIGAGTLGLCAGLFEEATFTREYLVHRPVSASRLFWTRQLGCGLVLFTWIVVTPALHLPAMVLFHPNGPLVEPARYWSMLNYGSVGVAFYALTLFAATVVRRAVLSVVIAFALSLALVLFFGISLYSSHAPPLIFQLLAPISCALAAPMLWAALRLSREPRDLDRPSSTPRLAAVAGALVFFALAGSVFLHILQLDLRRDITRRYPKMARLPDGTPLLLVQKDYQAPWRVDERHRRLEGDAGPAETVFEPRASSPLHPGKRPFGAGGRPLWGVTYERVMCGIPANCFLGSDGRLHVYAYDRDDGPALVQHLGKQTGEPFAPDAQAIGSWGRIALVGEPRDGTVWRYDLQRGGAGFEPAPLPNGDAFVEDLTEVIERPQAYVPIFANNPMVLRGRRGIYVPEKQGFAVAPPEIQRAVQALDRRRQQPAVQVELAGPVRFRVTVPAAGGGTAFSHDYAPFTGAERALDVQMQGLSLLRPPLLVVASLFFPRQAPALGNPTDDDARILLDPLVMLRARWPLVLDLLLGAGLAALAFRRLGRLGVPRGRRAFWTALVLTFGPAGFVVYRACEGDRAWQALETAPAPRPLVIQSAA
jgi:hypothetical protein